jgi:hypothetical protein
MNRGGQIMNLAKRIPLLGIVAGIALLIVGFNYDNIALLIVGGVLIAFGLFRMIRK